MLTTAQGAQTLSLSPSRPLLPPKLLGRPGERSPERTEARLTTQDAIHASTALQASCALFVTNDTDFRRDEGLPMAVLDDFADYGQF